MKFIGVLLLALFSLFNLSAQSPALLFDWWWPSRFEITPIPSAPFSSGTNIDQGDLGVAGQLRMADIGNPSAGIDIVFTGNFTDGISFNALSVGTVNDPFRIVNNGAVVVGTSTKGFATIGDNDYMEIYGASPASPFIVNAAGSGQSGIQWAAQVGGTSLKMQNWVLTNTASSGTLINSSTNDYRDMVIRFFRVPGAGTEGIYLGNTGTTFSTFESISIEHAYASDTQWDFIQVGHCTNLTLTKSTFYNGGISNTAGQDHGVQIVDTNGMASYTIFDHVPRICNISTHGFTFYRCLFKYYDATERGFIGRTDNLTYYPTARHNGEPILFNECYFIAESGAIVSTIIAVQERIADVEWRNCVFTDNIVAIALDQRVAGFTNDIIGTISTNGNTTSSTLPDPTYTNHTAGAYTTHGIQTHPFWYDKGMGFRNNKP